MSHSHQSSADTWHDDKRTSQPIPKPITATGLFQAVTRAGPYLEDDGLQSHEQEDVNQSVDSCVFSPLFEEVCRTGLAHIQSVTDTMGLGASLLRYVAHQYQGRRDIGILVKILTTHGELPCSPSARLLAVAQFAARGIWPNEDHVPSIVAYSEVLEELLSSSRGFLRGAFGSLERQWSEYLKTPAPWHSKFHILSGLLVSEARTAGPEFIALDLLSESSSLVQTYARRCTSPKDDSAALRIIAEATRLGVNAFSALRLYVTCAKHEPTQSRVPIEEVEKCVVALLSIPNVSPKLITLVDKEFSELLQQGVSPEIGVAYLRGVTLTSAISFDRDVPALAKTVKDLFLAKIEIHRVEYLLGAIQREELTSCGEITEALSRLLGVRQLEWFSEKLNTRVIESEQEFYSRSATTQLRGNTLSPILHQRLQLWEEVHDMHRGFTSRLASARRTPYREPPDLVQFVTDVGGEDSVKYINAENANLFPGKGFLFTRLKFERCFAPIPPQKGEKQTDGFDVYRTAWPELSPVFSDFSRTEFIFLRGLLAISCKSPKYNLLDKSGVRKHYALVVFNDHFRNPFQEVAYLIPTEGLKPLLQGAQIPASDFVGFDARRKDVNHNVRSPRDLIEAPAIKGLSIDIGGVDAILGGTSQGGQQLQGSAKFFRHVLESEKLEEDVRKHNDVVRRWNEREHSYHLSAQGQDAFHKLLHEFSLLATRRADLDRQLIEVETESEQKIWDLVNKYVSLHKLFCIGHAYWHRGYTPGRIVSTDHISIDTAGSDDDFTLQAPLQRQERAQVSSSSKVPVNRNALRMLVQAYELHAQRQKPGSSRSDFPLLVTCDATKTGVHPTTQFVLDTYDMTVTIGHQKIELSQGKMTADDELFWLTQIFPRVKDEPGFIQDLRFYPRESFEAYS